MFNLLLADANIYSSPADSTCLANVSNVSFEEGEFEMYPNPAIEILNIRYTPKSSSWAHLTDITISIYNSLGILVMQQQLGVQLATEFNFGTLPSGTYVVQISSSKGSVKQKVVYASGK